MAVFGELSDFSGDPAEIFSKILGDRQAGLRQPVAAEGIVDMLSAVEQFVGNDSGAFQVMETLVALELKGYIQEISKNYYIRSE